MNSTIYKHYIGYALIAILGGLLTGVLLGTAMYAPQVPGDLRSLAYALAGLVLLATAVVIWTYMLNRVVVSSGGITYYRYLTPFTSTTSSCDWKDVQDVTVTQGSIIAKALGYGTLTIQTAGARVNLTMTTIEDALYWRGQISRRATVADGAGDA